MFSQLIFHWQQIKCTHFHVLSCICSRAKLRMRNNKKKHQKKKKKKKLFCSTESSSTRILNAMCIIIHVFLLYVVAVKMHTTTTQTLIILSTFFFSLQNWMCGTTYVHPITRNLCRHVFKMNDAFFFFFRFMHTFMDIFHFSFGNAIWFFRFRVYFIHFLLIFCSVRMHRVTCMRFYCLILRSFTVNGC